MLGNGFGDLFPGSSKSQNQRSANRKRFGHQALFPFPVVLYATSKRVLAVEPAGTIRQIAVLPGAIVSVLLSRPAGSEPFNSVNCAPESALTIRFRFSSNVNCASGAAGCGGGLPWPDVTGALSA